MLVMQPHIAANMQPHKKCSIIADGTYDNRKREGTVFVTGESHTFGDLSVEGSSLRQVLDIAAAVRGDAGRENVTSSGATGRRLQHR